MVFGKYVRTHDKSLIVIFTIDDLEFVLADGISDKNFPHYKAIETRVSELKDARTNKRSQKEVWIDRGIGFMSGIVSTTICAYILKW